MEFGTRLTIESYITNRLQTAPRIGFTLKRIYALEIDGGIGTLANGKGTDTRVFAARNLYIYTVEDQRYLAEVLLYDNRHRATCTVALEGISPRSGDLDSVCHLAIDSDGLGLHHTARESGCSHTEE